MAGWLINRVTITLTVIAIVAAGWNLYVAAHDDGILEGVVIGPSGGPVPDAKVVLSERTIVSLAPIAETTTDAEGRFRFEGHDRHALVLNAGREGLSQSSQRRARSPATPA